MANPEHVAKLMEGVEAWNKWREENPTVKPDLRGTDFNTDEFHDTALYAANSPQIPFLETMNLLAENILGRISSNVTDGANLSMADLTRVDLYGANLGNANLSASDLRSARLEMANLRGATLSAARLDKANFSRANLESAILWGADLKDADFRLANLQNSILAGTHVQNTCFLAANLEGADVTGIKFDRKSVQSAFKGIRVSTCFGSQMFKSFAQDQDYIEELRGSGRWGSIKFRIWWLFADCGRSFSRWAGWSVGFAVLLGYIYYLMGPDAIATGHLPFSLKSMIYYSVVTFTTLGFGDITPKTENAAIVVMAEVILGYIMLGGLISILANKVARRS